MKFNPFRPNSLVSIGMFSGRGEELHSIERCLFQAKHGNPQHFLIEGERGIGKSSLFYFIQLLASGRIKREDGSTFNFLVVSLDLGQCEDQIDIVREIGKALQSAIADRNNIKELAKKAFDFLTNWEVMGVKYKKDRERGDDSANLAGLVDTVADVLVEAKDSLDGVLILIDEADRPSEEAGLGLFLKLFTERLTRKECGNCLMGLAGLPTLVPKLRASHESSPRVFEAMTLEPLEELERIDVINRGIADANKRNNQKTDITPDASKMIALLSEGYPHFIQQFAYCAFEKDTDNVIDVSDVAGGAYQQNGALEQLGHKYFNKMYFEQINSENYRRVLNAMAAHQNSWVSRQEIILESGVGETNVDNALKALRGRDIIIADESRRGFYKLPTRSFATWINAIKSVEEQTGNAGQFKLDID
ncbi:ATP-binding protein [Methylocystis sp. S23]